MYLGLDPSSVVCSFEGDPATINIALTNFESYDISNIKLIEGNIDTTLPEFLQNPKKIDLVLIDANHRYEPTLQYFNLLSRRIANKGIVIMDDIYHSKEMKRAWDELKMHKLVYGSIDLYRLGILFFDPSLNHQHYILSM
jgi:predicted O-methyltransferase YrrM